MPFCIFQSSTPSSQHWCGLQPKSWHLWYTIEKCQYYECEHVCALQLPDCLLLLSADAAMAEMMEGMGAKVRGVPCDATEYDSMW